MPGTSIMVGPNSRPWNATWDGDGWMMTGGRVGDVRNDDRQDDAGVVPSIPDPRSADDDGLGDPELWRDLRAGDEEALRALFLRHSSAVYNFAFRRTSSWAIAEDVAQATFITLWRRALTGDLAELRLPSARPLLFAIARKESGSHLRSARRQARLTERIAAHLIGHPADNVDDWLTTETRMRQIIESLRVLPENQRDVIALVRWSGLSLAEAAETLGIPVGTVKSRLNRAHARLVNTPLAGLLRGERE